MYRTAFASLAFLSALSALSSAVDLESHNELASLDMLLESGSDEVPVSLGEVSAQMHGRGKVGTQGSRKKRKTG